MNIIGDIMLSISLLVVMIFGFFIMNHLDTFLNQHQMVIEKEKSMKTAIYDSDDTHFKAYKKQNRPINSFDY